MNYIDAFLVLIFVLAAFQGFHRGFILEIFSFIAFFIGVFTAVKYAEPLALWLVDESEWLGLVKIAVFIFLFVSLSFLINSMAKFLRKSFELAMLGWLDRTLGTVIGIGKWAFLLSMIIWILSANGLDIDGSDLQSSLIFPYLVDLAPETTKNLQDIFPFLEDLIDWGRDFEPEEQFV